jgi:hypothetical protein
VDTAPDHAGKLLCPECGAEQAATEAKCAACGAENLLRSRYRLRQVLGHNVAVTFRADDLATGHPVVIKELSTRTMESWKHQELFVREAEVLRQLDHGQIPKYLDHFSMGTGRRMTSYLVVELIAGESVNRVLERRRYDEEGVLELLDGVLDVLVYLHGLRPPVIHRDLKPSNLMQRPDGTMAVIDFGSVKDVFRNRASGDTIAGTFGFMAPEQLRGEALPASDYYALGAVALNLVSRVLPDTFADGSGGLEWRGKVVVSEPMGRLLGVLLAPEPEGRPATAEEAKALVAQTRAALGEPTAAPAAWSLTKAPVSGELEVVLPPPAAPTPGKGGMTVAVVSGVLLMLLLAIALGRQESSLSVAESEARTAALFASLPTCEPATCQPVPMGIKGLSFGMSLEAATVAFPELGQVPESSRRPPRWEGGDDLGFGLAGGGQMPGIEVSSVRTSVGELPATCKLAFAVDQTLSKIACVLDELGSLAAHDAVELQMVANLYLKYGPAPEVFDHPPKFGFEVDKRDRQLIWRGGTSTLEVRATYKSYGSFQGSMPGFSLPDASHLAITNVWSRHTALEDELRSRARARAAAEQEERARAQAKKDREALESLEKGKRALEEEL